MKKEAAGGSPPLNDETVTRTIRTRVLIAMAVFLLAFSVRVLTWHDTRLEVGKVQSSVAGDYQRIAQLLERDGLRGFFSSSSGLADLNNLGHPPGYSILIATVHSVLGGSQTAIQFMQIVFDAAAAVIIFLLLAEFFSMPAATLAGFFAALAPQLAWNSVLLLPDSLAVFPILLSVYLLARTRRTPRLLTFLAAGALVGLSCWLRANALLLTVFLAAAVLLLHGGKKWRYSLAVICGTLVIVLPLTIRNAVVFHRFIPLSLGAGQTFLEGISDYDTSGRFGIPNTDLGIMRQEAEMFQRPDYYGFLFKPDGVERERWRIQRGLSVIKSHPLWFSSVMIRRAASMTRLERAQRISAWPAVSHPLDVMTSRLVKIVSPAELLGQCHAQSPQAKVFLEDPASQSITFVGNNPESKSQVYCSSFGATPGTDNVLELPIKIEQGRMRVSLVDRAGQSHVSEIISPVEAKQPNEQPWISLRLPFVATSDLMAIEFNNEAAQAAPIVHVGGIKLYELGPARFLWTRYLRIPLCAIQRLFITAVFLPLALIGLGVTIFRKQTAALVVLSPVPLYYFTVQSAFHTEYRYVLAMNYFLFAFAAVGISWIIQMVSSLSFWERVRVRV